MSAPPLAEDIAELRRRVEALPDAAGAIRVAAPGSWAVIDSLTRDLIAALEDCHDGYLAQLDRTGDAI